MPPGLGGSCYQGRSASRRPCVAEREREFERESSRKREREKEREIKKKKKERKKERMESWKNDQMC